MNYDLVVSDFDGTLRRSDDTISERTVRAIADYTAAGGTFAVSTGRAYASIVQRLEELGLRGSFPVMSCQGALMRDSLSGETLSAIPLEKSAAVEFLRRAERMGLTAQFYTAEKIYAPALNEINRTYFERNRLLPEEVGCVSDYAEKTDEPILKVLCMIDPADRARVLGEMQGIAGARAVASHAMLIEAVSDKAGKGKGLELACRRLGVDISRSVAIGDELNDIDMIRAAGLGVAVGNAVPECKRAADVIVADCDHDGVAELLETILNS